jgi:hypothetical protein
MSSKPVVVVVDPVSTGAFCLDYILSQPDFIVTTLWSPSISPAARALAIPGLNTNSHYSVVFTTLEETCQELRRLHGDNIAHIVSLSEPGVETADLLSHTLSLASSNGILYSPHRRDKFKQLERLKEVGLRTAKQKLVTKFDECVEFMSDIQGTCVLKPATSAGSDDVFKIPFELDQDGEFRKDILEKRFESTYGKINKMGIENDVLIIQEFLEGAEYVMDTVSVNGVHKLVSCWVYAKISIKDSGDFVYLGMKLCDAENDPKIDAMFSYICKVLDALEVKNYAGHSELIYTKNGPCLLEIGTRPHGGMGCFIPLQNNCYGYAIPQFLYATLLGNKSDKNPQNDVDDNDQKSPRYFDEFATLPKLLKKNILGYQIDIVNYNPDGILLGFDEEIVETIRNFSTFLSMDLPAPGKWLPQTYDCFTIPASLTLVGDKEEVEKHVEMVRGFEKKLFIIQPGPKPSE